MGNFNYYLERLVIRNQHELREKLTWNIEDYCILRPYAHVAFRGRLLCLPAKDNDRIEDRVMIFLRELGFQEVLVQGIDEPRYLALCASDKPKKLLLECEEHCTHAVYRLEYLSKSLPDNGAGYDLVHVTYEDLTYRVVAYNGKIITVRNQPEHELFVEATRVRLIEIGYNANFLKPLLVNNYTFVFVV